MVSWYQRDCFAVPPAPALARANGRTIIRPIGIGAGTGFLLAALVHIVYLACGSNFHTVIAGGVYRSAQPSPADLRYYTAQYGIQTVINLRGRFAPETDYEDECATVRCLHINQLDFPIPSSNTIPRQEVLRIMTALETAREPILIHCQFGADRTGWASAVALLLKTDTSLDEAQKQLHVRYGHKPFGLVRCWNRFFEQYAAWLHDQGLTHTPAHFHEWVATAYRDEPATLMPPWQAAWDRKRQHIPGGGVLEKIRQFFT